MPDSKLMHRGDPRTLSDKHPGRSRNQDDAPPLTPLAFSEKKDQEQKERTVSSAAPSPADLERRKARSRSAVPYGTRGSRKAGKSS